MEFLQLYSKDVDGDLEMEEAAKAESVEDQNVLMIAHPFLMNRLFIEELIITLKMLQLVTTLSG